MSLPSFKSDVEATDEPNQEDGKVRSYPHERGQWTTHVHASLSEESVERLREVLGDALIDSSPGALRNIRALDDFHVSLFRGHCVLRFHHIPLVVNALTQSLAKLSSFTVVLNFVQILTNDENTRKFISVCDRRSQEESSGQVQQIMKTIDKTLRQFVDLKEYSDATILHSSLLWFSPNSVEESHLTDVTSKLQEEFDDEPIIEKIDSVALKIGKQLYNIPLGGDTK